MQQHSKPYTIRKIKKSLSIAWTKRGGLGFALKYRNEPVLFTSEGLGSDLTFFLVKSPSITSDHLRRVRKGWRRLAVTCTIRIGARKDDFSH